MYICAQVNNAVSVFIHSCNMHKTLEVPHVLLYHIASGFISIGANFPKWSALSYSRNYPDLEIHDPNNPKTYMSDISHKAYTCTQAF